MSQWFKNKRQAFIRSQLATCGYIQRQDLQNEFDISVALASSDIAAFREANPGAMTYDTSTKRYVTAAPRRMAYPGRHIMLDIETWGVAPGCDLRSIGAVVFDPFTGALGNTFYANTLPGDEFGLVRNPETEAWWSKQSAAAQLSFDDVPVELPEALRAFGEFILHTQDDDGETVRIWSNGPSFDEAILAHAYRAVGQAVPWDYDAGRDTRTVIDILGVPQINRVGTHHNALDDAKHQVALIAAALQRIPAA